MVFKLEPLPEGWDDLYNEFVSLRENKRSSYVKNLLTEIANLKTKYQLVETCCAMITTCYDNYLLEEYASLKAELKKFGHRYAYDMTNDLHFARDIRATLSSNKKLIATWLRKEDEYERYKKKNDGQAMQLKDFYMWAVAFSEHYGRHVTLDNTLIVEWCIMLNDFERYTEVVNASRNSKRYGKS